MGGSGTAKAGTCAEGVISFQQMRDEHYEAEKRQLDEDAELCGLFSEVLYAGEKLYGKDIAGAMLRYYSADSTCLVSA